jgi:hypothetical protein
VPGPFFFAWAGGAIEPQITLATNGTTHGAHFETSTLVGSITAGEQQLTGLVSSQGLITGALYRLQGDGLDSFSIVDDSILSGVPGSLNLADPATGTTGSGQFIATKAATIGTILATVTQGSSTVTLDAPGLAAGTYGIAGTAIGETNVPIGTTDGTSATTGGGTITIGSAYVSYSGGGIGNLYIYAATPFTETISGPLGEVESVTTWTVASQPVRATATGQVPVVLSGFPDSDPASVTGIPPSALMTLTPGLLYNITGNGIEVGSTFVAPSGGTEISLDLPATASDINAILTITGPRTPNAPFNPAAHNRFDEEVVNIEIAQEEGGLATLTIGIKNPNVGLLATGRNLWCWLSWDRAWPDGAPDIVPLFNGRLIGVPALQADEMVQLQFLARPDDLNAQKVALAAALQVLPYYDPVWLAGNQSLDTVLEAYSALWHIDRRSLLLTTSDVLEGEDGILDIGEDISLYDNFSLAYGEPPLIAVTATGTVSWQQQASGAIDVTQQIIAAFYTSGSAYNRAVSRGAWSTGGGGLIQVMVGDGLKSDWPRPGASIGGGWSLSGGVDSSGNALCYIVEATWFRPLFYKLIYEAQAPYPNHTGFSPDETNLSVYTNQVSTFTMFFPVQTYKIRMTLEYKADRKRTETVTAVMMAGLQPTLSDSTEQDREAIAFNSDFVGQSVDLDGSIPIGNVAYRSYFQTGRGTSSVEYLMLAARAKMRARSRAVDITFAVPWRDAVDISLRHSVQLTDRRLPGGIATGKVKSYRLSVSDAGIMLGEFTIGCSIGTDEAMAPQAGVPVYVDAGYVQPGYQILAGAQTPAVAGDFAYQSLDDFAVVDDNLDLTHLTAEEAVINCTVANGLVRQIPELASFQNSTSPGNGDPRSALASMTTTVTLNLQPLQGSEFHTDFYPAVTPLRLPKTIDLSATAPGA